MPGQTYTIEQAMTLAVQHHQAGRLSQAEAVYRQILAVHPNHAPSLHNLSEIAYSVGKLDVATELVNRAIALAPNVALYHNTLAAIFLAMGRFEDAFQASSRAIELDGQLSQAHANLGVAYAKRGDMHTAIACFQRAIQLDGQNPYAHDGLGLALLTIGQLQPGWREQEWRWGKREFQAKRQANSPIWDGSDLAGKSILLQIEQGYGDMFQFCRYAPLLSNRGARVLMEVTPDMRQVMASLRGNITLLAGGFTPPPSDVNCQMMSLPLHFGTTLETIPATIPYLSAPADLVRQWQSRLANDRRLKVGLTWAGRPTHRDDQNRSMSLLFLTPLARIPGLRLFSLQKGPAAQQADAAHFDPPLTDFTAELNDFADTAALIANLNLVISVDTAVAHLAGAMGKPVWLLLPLVPDWRWLLDRPDSPWYPTMKIFRCRQHGQWETPILQVQTELSGLAAEGKV